MTALWIIELSWSSWSALWCAHGESLTCQTLHYTHMHVDKLFLHVPAARADGTLCGVPQFISCCLEPWDLNMFVSFTDKTEDFQGTFSLLKCVIHLFCSTLSVCYKTDDTDDEGEWSNYVIIYAMISSCFDWQMVGVVNNKCNLSYSIIVTLQWLHVCQVEQPECTDWYELYNTVHLNLWGPRMGWVWSELRKWKLLGLWKLSATLWVWEDHVGN